MHISVIKSSERSRLKLSEFPLNNNEVFYSLEVPNEEFARSIVRHVENDVAIRKSHGSWYEIDAINLATITK